MSATCEGTATLCFNQPIGLPLPAPARGRGGKKSTTKSDARISRQTGQPWGRSAQISQKGRLQSSSIRSSSLPAIIPGPFPWLWFRWMVDGDSGNLVNPFMRVTNQMTRHFAAWITIAAASHPFLAETHHIDILSTGQKSHCVSTLRRYSNALLQQTIGLPSPAPVLWTRFHDQVGRTNPSRDRTPWEPKRTNQPKQRPKSSSTRFSFPADHPKPVPLAAVSLDGGWGQWEPRQSTHARHQSNDEAFGCLELPPFTPAWLRLITLPFRAPGGKSHCVSTL